MNGIAIITINSLPEEILQQIIFLLPIPDLKNAILVSRRWLHIGEQELAKVSRLCINYKNVEIMKQLLNSQRMKMMRSVKFLSWFMSVEKSEEVIKEISKHSDIEDLILRGNGLLSVSFTKQTKAEYVNPNILSSCINGMKKVSLSKTWLSVQHVETMFRDISKETNIIQFDLKDNILVDGCPNMMAFWVEKIQKEMSRKSIERSSADVEKVRHPGIIDTENFYHRNSRCACR